ncbi:MAG: HNH endonuclease signature motif containing protein, partial [Microlunatus sp.]
DLYRDRRIASPAQTLALIARDGGCSFPGCDVAPEWCERHHVISWLDGGDTNLNNLTLVCRYHHHYFEQRRWACKINTDGLPVWIPPKWIDPEQKPILHPRITISNWRRQQPLDL